MKGMGLLTSGITKVVSVLALGFGPKFENYGYGGLGSRASPSLSGDRFGFWWVLLNRLASAQ